MQPSNLAKEVPNIAEGAVQVSIHGCLPPGKWQAAQVVEISQSASGNTRAAAGHRATKRDQRQVVTRGSRQSIRASPEDIPGAGPIGGGTRGYTRGGDQSEDEGQSIRASPVCASFSPTHRLPHAREWWYRTASGPLR
eukprot:759370-Prorocentrum_minimum.AAC.2